MPSSSSPSLERAAPACPAPLSLIRLPTPHSPQNLSRPNPTPESVTQREKRYPIGQVFPRWVTLCLQPRLNSQQVLKRRGRARDGHRVKEPNQSQSFPSGPNIPLSTWRTRPDLLWTPRRLYARARYDATVPGATLRRAEMVLALRPRRVSRTTSAWTSPKPLSLRKLHDGLLNVEQVVRALENPCSQPIEACPGNHKKQKQGENPKVSQALAGPRGPNKGQGTQSEPE